MTPPTIGRDNLREKGWLTAPAALHTAQSVMERRGIAGSPGEWLIRMGAAGCLAAVAPNFQTRFSKFDKPNHHPFRTTPIPKRFWSLIAGSRKPDGFNILWTSQDWQLGGFTTSLVDASDDEVACYDPWNSDLPDRSFGLYANDVCFWQFDVYGLSLFAAYGEKYTQYYSTVSTPALPDSTLLMEATGEVYDPDDDPPDVTGRLSDERIDFPDPSKTANSGKTGRPAHAHGEPIALLTIRLMRAKEEDFARYTAESAAEELGQIYTSKNIPANPSNVLKFAQGALRAVRAERARDGGPYASGVE